MDATINIVTEQTTIITENPVEEGSDITDHARVLPLQLSLDCFISNAPTDALKSVLQGLTGGLTGKLLGDTVNVGGASLVGTGLGAVIGGSLASKLGGLERNGDDSEYPKKAFQALIEEQRSRVPFTIETFFTAELYTNMLIESLSVPQESADGDGLRFSMSCKQVKIVQSQTGQADESFIKGVQAAQSANNKLDQGKQVTEAVAGKTQGNASILLGQLQGLLGG